MAAVGGERERGTTTRSRSLPLGLLVESPPAPVIPEHAVDIAAGPLRFVLESRSLADDLVQLQINTDHREADDSVSDDGGASVHVFGAQDGLEHLRFDCFDKHPHYHYIHNDHQEQGNVIVRFDQIAMGDPTEWTMSCLRRRLPEMLDYAGAAGLAMAVRADPGAVASGAEIVGQMLSDVQKRARSRRFNAS